MKSVLALLHSERGITEICQGVVGGQPFVIRSAEHIAVGVLAIETRQSAECGHFINGDLGSWLSDLCMFITEGGNAIGYRDRFFRKTAAPLMQANDMLFDQVNPHRKQAALAKVASMSDSIWKLAMTQFINQQPETK